MAIFLYIYRWPSFIKLVKCTIALIRVTLAIRKTEMSVTEAEVCFEVCDKDKSGQIVCSELKEVLQELCKDSEFNKEDIQACCDVSFIYKPWILTVHSIFKGGCQNL